MDSTPNQNPPTMQMQSLSIKHPLHEWLDKALRTRTACMPHKSNLGNLLQQFPHMCTRIETIETYIRSPWWTPMARIRIETTKVAAKKHYDETQTHLDPTTMTFYTDGSGIEGRIGTAAHDAAANEASHQYLGSETQFNVYVAELTAVQLAIKQLRNHCEYRICRIYIDSQAAIRAIDRPRRQSGQSIIRDILDHIDEIISEHEHLQFEII
jgi:ribonuclease HI